MRPSQNDYTASEMTTATYAERLGAFPSYWRTASNAVRRALPPGFTQKNLFWFGTPVTPITEGRNPRPSHFFSSIEQGNPPYSAIDSTEATKAQEGNSGAQRYSQSIAFERTAAPRFAGDSIQEVGNYGDNPNPTF